MPSLIIDKDLCARCGTCAAVCPMGIIPSVTENTFPHIAKGMESFCISCGHCEVFCPSQALVLDIPRKSRTPLKSGTGEISSDDISVYLKKRRSIRQYNNELVSKDTINQILDVARYAASGGNGQPVQWIVVYTPEKVHRIAELTIEWMRAILNTPHPLSPYLPGLIHSWENGNDVICRGAPHLLIACIPEDNPIAPVDSIIALTHFDIAAPAYGIGTCWGGFVAMAAIASETIQKELGIPEGQKCAYAMMFGIPVFKVYGIPEREPLKVSWK